MFGGKALNKFLLLILTSQLLLNADEATKLISTFSKPQTITTNTTDNTEQKNSIQNGKIYINPGIQVNSNTITGLRKNTTNTNSLI